MTHHPTVIRRYRQIRERTGCLDRVGELTAREHLSRLDPEGLLSLAEELEGGPERAREALEALIREP